MAGCATCGCPLYSLSSCLLYTSYQVTIANLVPEGTVVQQGQFIASLDRTEMDGKIKESQTEIDKIVTQLDQAKIDTAIEMRSLRDQLVNIRFSMKEKELSLELSRYEPEAIKQQAKLDLERSQRELSQLENKLTLTKDCLLYTSRCV